MNKMRILFPVFFLSLILAIANQDISYAQNQQNGAVKEQKESEIEAPDKVDVQPTARDEEIQQRLADILNATGWFSSVSVRVQDGVVFLEGTASNADQKDWAESLARRTQDVAAVVNRLKVKQPDVWDFEPIMTGLRDLWIELLSAFPKILFGIIVLIISGIGAVFVSSLVRSALSKKFYNSLIRRVVSKGVGLAFFLLGLYIVFQIVGLSTVAVTILGGTGLLGVILGIAFREITENLLASIFLSIQSPFSKGDLVDIEGTLGYVQGLTVRATILMAQNGNHIQIPNATVYKSTIYNYTSNPNLREDFIVGIGYEDVIEHAQEVALQVLDTHQAVLKDPEPWVLVDSLGSSTVNLRIYFWLDGSRYSWQKVKSSVIRLVTNAFDDAGISMPDEAREILFPDGIDVNMSQAEGDEKSKKGTAPVKKAPSRQSTKAEGGLESEAEEIEEQARKSRNPEQGKDLLQQNNP